MSATKFVKIVLLISLISTFLFEFTNAQEYKVIDIGNHRELFVDHFMIDKLVNSHLQLHQPRPEGMTLKFDKSWEGKFSAYITVECNLRPLSPYC